MPSPASVDKSLHISSRAAELSTELYAIQEACRNVGGSVEATATELEMLSTTLSRLAQEMQQSPHRYSEVFINDLREVLVELGLVLDEISECSLALQKADSSWRSPLRFLFKGYEVRHLEKHLAAMKTTLVVMRTVLFYGKEFFETTADYPVEDEPVSRSIHQAWGVFNTAMANNSNAIAALGHLEQDRPSMPGTDGPNDEQRSFTAGGGGFGDAEQLPDETRDGDQHGSHRRRGKRLAVHTFLANINTHPNPGILHHEWLHSSENLTSVMHPVRIAIPPSPPPPTAIGDNRTHQHTSSLSYDVQSSRFSSSSSSPEQDDTNNHNEESQNERRLVNMSRRLSRTVFGRHGQ